MSPSLYYLSFGGMSLIHIAYIPFAASYFLKIGPIDSESIKDKLQVYIQVTTTPDFIF